MYSVLTLLLLTPIWTSSVKVNSSEASWSLTCLNGAAVDLPCNDVGNDWDSFRFAIDNADYDEYIVFCPFEVFKESTAVAARPQTKARFACQTKGQCNIKGDHQHVNLNRADAITLFYGFTFEGATESSVYITSTSTNKQQFCHCDFNNNESTGRGGAVRTNKETQTSFSHCSFNLNGGELGGAIYNRGNMEINNSTFVQNEAQMGGAIALSSYASLKVQNVSFINNTASQGPVIFGKESFDSFNDQYVDGGGNYASESECRGFYIHRVNSTCQEFELQGIPLPIKVTINATVNITVNATINDAEIIKSNGTGIHIDNITWNVTGNVTSNFTRDFTGDVIIHVSTSSSKAARNVTTIDADINTTNLTGNVSAILSSSVPSYSPSFTMIPTTSSIPSFSSYPSMTPTYNASYSENSSINSSSTPSAVPSRATLYVPPRDPESEMLPLVARKQPKGYYNWNVMDKDFGPEAWGDVDVSSSDYIQFLNQGLHVTTNECGKYGNQTPIDFFRTNVPCSEFHQIRAHGGDWKNMTRQGEVTFQVTPSYLRIQFDGEGERIPRADSPGGFTEIFSSHLELTLPSLHTLNGQHFDAEYSIYHMQSIKNRSLVVSVLIDASENAYNHQFQRMLNAWVQVENCGIEAGRRLRFEDIHDDDDTDTEEWFETAPLDEHDERRLASQARIGGRFNIYGNDLVPSIYWYAYAGSLPRPPCTRAVHWRVLDVAMRISHRQLQTLKDILSKGACKDSPFREGLGDMLARPIQSSWKREVWQCTKDNYLSDCERFGLLCPAPDFHGDDVAS